VAMAEFLVENVGFCGIFSGLAHGLILGGIGLKRTSKVMHHFARI
jgi:hypothetical protein